MDAALGATIACSTDNQLSSAQLTIVAFQRNGTALRLALTSQFERSHTRTQRVAPGDRLIAAPMSAVEG